MPHACPWHAGTIKSKKQDSAPLMSSQPPSMSIMMRYSTSTITVPQTHSLNHSMLKSNSLERISGELLTRSFSYSALRTYMHIPTKKLLTPFLHDNPPTKSLLSRKTLEFKRESKGTSTNGVACSGHLRKQLVFPSKTT